MSLTEFLLSLARAITLLFPILISGIFFIACMKLRWLEILNKPIDFGLKLGSERIFGPNKNWRGAVIYVLGGTAVVFILHVLSQSQNWVAPVYQAEPLQLGLATCSAYVVGELVNSFVKRRLGIASGGITKSAKARIVQAFFDNADGALAYGLVLYLLFRPDPSYSWLALLLAFFTHAGSDALMRKLSLKKKQKS